MSFLFSCCCPLRDSSVPLQTAIEEYENIYDKVLPYVSIGSIEALEDALHFDAIVSAVPPNRMPSFVQHRAHMQVPVKDEPDAPIGRYFSQAADFIHEHVQREQDVLVHCEAGISRSTTLVIAYMMRYKGYANPYDALNVIRKKRPQVNPNDGFMRQLVRWKK